MAASLIMPQPAASQAAGTVSQTSAASGIRHEHNGGHGDPAGAIFKRDQ